MGTVSAQTTESPDLSAGSSGGLRILAQIIARGLTKAESTSPKDDKNLNEVSGVPENLDGKERVYLT